MYSFCNKGKKMAEKKRKANGFIITLKYNSQFVKCKNIQWLLSINYKNVIFQACDTAKVSKKTKFIAKNNLTGGFIKNKVRNSKMAEGLALVAFSMAIKVNDI